MNNLAKTDNDNQTLLDKYFNGKSINDDVIS